MTSSTDTTAELKPDNFRFSIRYPWRTLLLVKLLLFYALLLLQPELISLLKLPDFLLRPEYFSAAFMGFLIFAWFDLRSFMQQKNRVKNQFKKLWDNKRQLQQRAQTSASHTDKLKMFISDKLLEYIEYDEKYLHFRSIAAEVRHNGVISFDKVQSALQYAASHSLPDDNGSTALQYQEALSGMRYLWDLLDLSTTDNMAMHIGAHISRCEELLFQAELQGTALESLPLQPVFDPQQALLDTLRLHLGATLCDADGKPEPAALFQATTDAVHLTDSDGLFSIELQPCDRLAGNPNHLILLLENLLKNARYYATKKQYKSRFPPVSIRLWEAQQHLCLTLYNRGPHIADDDRGQIFKLGFSTRRARGHHGKGLGLYFVQQITQGFDGDIAFDNVHNRSDDYYLRLEYRDGSVEHLHLQQRLQDELPLVGLAGSENAAVAQFEQRLSKPLVTVEISSEGQPQVQRLDCSGGPVSWLDPQHPGLPRWLLQCSGRKGETLIFTPLDIRGVQFNLRLPTVSGRLDGAGTAGLQAPDVHELHSRFRGPDDF